MPTKRATQIFSLTTVNNVLPSVRQSKQRLKELGGSCYSQSVPIQSALLWLRKHAIIWCPVVGTSYKWWWLSLPISHSDHTSFLHSVQWCVIVSCLMYLLRLDFQGYPQNLFQERPALFFKHEKCHIFSFCCSVLHLFHIPLILNRWIYFLIFSQITWKLFCDRDMKLFCCSPN